MVAPAEKASLLGSQFDCKCVMSSSSHLCPLSCFPQSRCNSLALKTPVLLRLLFDFNTYEGVDPLDAFPLFLKIVADIIAPKLSIIFRGLIRRGSFLECCRSANVTAIPKGAPSPERKTTVPG